MVPCPWVDSINQCIYWPQKGKPLGVYITDWSAPGEDWRYFNIIETIFEAGTKDEAEQMINKPTTEESDSDMANC